MPVRLTCVMAGEYFMQESERKVKETEKKKVIEPL